MLECSLYIHLNPVAFDAPELAKCHKRAERQDQSQAPAAVRARRLKLGREAGGMDYTAVSMTIKRFEQRLQRGPRLRWLTQRLLEEGN